MKNLPEAEGNPENNQQNNNQQQTPKRNLSFTINDGTTGINGATVKLGDVTRTTGGAGGCTFTDIEDGSYSVEVSAEGYDSKTESITVSENNTSFTISLVAAASSGSGLDLTGD